MHVRGQKLINTSSVEAIPAWLARARGSATARRLAHADWLLRRKSDGRFLAAVGGAAVISLDAATQRTGDGIAEAMRAVHRGFGEAVELDERAPPYASLGIPDDYAERHVLVAIAEPDELAYAGRDRYQRPLWLTAEASRAWSHMRDAARADGIALDAISGYRSHAYQFGIFERKLRRGQSIEQILRVNAAPGFSEHHSGCALDLGTPGDPPAEESFEGTPAFDWLRQKAGSFGFTLSYPHDNPHAITYEPWHWCWHPVRVARASFLALPGEATTDLPDASGAAASTRSADPDSCASVSV